MITAGIIFLVASTRLLQTVGGFSGIGGIFQQQLQKRRGTTTKLSLSSRSKYNPFGTLLGDMASSLLNKNNIDIQDNPELDEEIKELGTSWETIRYKLHSLQTPEERNFRENVEKGIGKASPLNKIRLYDTKINSKDDICVTFFRDSASWCPYCQKVWMTLEEKQIPYRIEKINMNCYGDKPRSFLSLQPNGNIPVAIINGKTYGQSNDIIYALEQQFTSNKQLVFPDRQEETTQLLQLERSLFSAWMYWLTGSRDPQRYKQNFIQQLDIVEQHLSNNNNAGGLSFPFTSNNKKGPFFLGNKVSIVDIQFAPFLERMVASLLYFKGFQIRFPKDTSNKYPAINQWFDAMEQLESYQLTKSDYYTHCWDLPPQLGGCTYEDEGLPFEKAINGQTSPLLNNNKKSWSLPLVPHNGGVEPDWDWSVKNSAEAKRQVVERLSHNYEAITSFAARGAGQKGLPPVSAPLADPNATPNRAVKMGIETILQTICITMLDNQNNNNAMPKNDTQMQQIAKLAMERGGEDYTRGLIASLTYARDRVGVPRDMQLPAARQLRAHFNWSIDILSSQLGE